MEKLPPPRMTQRPPPPFITWLVLSVQATRPVVARGLAARRRFLEAQIAKERETLRGIRADVGPTIAVAEAVVTFGLQQFELELRWLEKLEALRRP